MVTLTTERLILRVHTAADLDACTALWADPEVVKFVGNKVSTREQSWARLQRYVGHWQLSGYGFFAVVDRFTAQYLGEVGMANFERDITPPVSAFETGWVLAAAAQGRGLASEALRAVLGWTDVAFPGQTTTCIIDVHHVASLRVAEKAGYRERLRTTYHGDPCVVLDRRTAPTAATAPTAP
jgi:RimJ/RimL family protein N-acetyltransferase